MRKLPPLNSLRAFEAAARLLSFSKAADELSVTPAAISQQIKILEDYFDYPLFHRHPRGLSLTDCGEQLLPNTSDAFDQLHHAVRLVRAKTDTSILTVSVSPSLGAKWLVPNLESFRHANPKFDIRLDASDRLVDFEKEDVDIAIRYGAGNYRGLVSKRLFANYTFPVCSPELTKGKRAVRSPKDLMHHTLLHTEWVSISDTAPHWPTWLKVMGVNVPHAARGPRFTNETMGLQAAIEGQGILLSSTAVATNDLAKGLLVRPFGDMQEANNITHYLVYPKSHMADPKVQAFCVWIRSIMPEK